MMVFTELHFVIDGRYNFSCHRWKPKSCGTNIGTIKRPFGRFF
jgi:hypothetical protein